MRRTLAAGLVTLAALPWPARSPMPSTGRLEARSPVSGSAAAPPASAPLPDGAVAKALPTGAQVVATQSGDLTGDGVPEVLVGYTLPRPGMPPTEGHTAVLERSPSGGYVRYDLEGTFPGHYHPRFKVMDLTGDGKPELIRENAGGGAWQMLSVFRREPGDGYAALLHDPAPLHHLWDANGDGLPEVLRYERTFKMYQRGAGSIRWMGSRFVTWHSARWYEAAEGTPGGEQPMANLVGLTLDQVIPRTNRRIGLVIPVDSPAPAGQVVRQDPPPGTVGGPDGQVHLAIAAGDTSVKAGPLPPIAAVAAIPEQWQDDLGIPATSTAAQRQRWEAWLGPAMKQVSQTIHISQFGLPGYVIRLRQPWTVTAGGRRLAVRFLGIPTRTPFLGLIFLAEQGRERGPVWPEYVTALYSPALRPPAPPPARPLRQYLQEQKGLEVFLTLAPASWYEAIRLRGIARDGWPAADPGPPLQGTPLAPKPYAPEPDHATVTVLNGTVRRTVREGETFRVEVASAPGRVHLWPLPLKGLPMGARPVIHLIGPGGQALADPIHLPLSSWSGPAPEPPLTPGAPERSG